MLSNDSLSTNDRLNSLALDVELKANMRGLALARLVLEKHGWTFENYSYVEDFLQGSSDGGSWYGEDSQKRDKIDRKLMAPRQIMAIESCMMVELLAKYVKERYVIAFWQPRDPKTGRTPFLPVNEKSSQVEKDVVRGVIAVLLQCGIKLARPKIEKLNEEATLLIEEASSLYKTG